MAAHLDQKRRVLHVGKYYPPHMGGTEVYLRDLVREQSLEYQVKVLVANDSPHFQKERCDGATILRIPTFGSVASMPIAPTLPWNIAVRNADIVHIHLPNPWAALAYLVSGHQGAVIVTHHCDTMGRQGLRRISDPFVNAIRKRASAIIISSARYRDSSVELAPFRDKCRVIPLGLDPAPFEHADPSAVRSIRERFGNNIVLSVCRLVPYKGMRYLIQALRDVDATLVHIGTGPLAAELMQQARELGVASRVHMLGRVEDISPYLHAAAMMVLPSVTRAESFGIVQLEAMAAGLPIINTEIESGVPEVSPHGLSGVTVPPENSAALSAAIDLLLKNPSLRRQYGAAGYERVREEFSIGRMAEGTKDVYEDAWTRVPAELTSRSSPSVP